MHQYIFQNGLLIVIEVYGSKKTGSIMVPIQLMVALIGMGLGGMDKPGYNLMVPLVLLSVEMDALS